MPRDTQMDLLGKLSISAEGRLLLCVARPYLDASTRERIGALMQAGIDWQRLTALAVQNKVLPLLYWNLRTHSIVPQAVRTDWQQRFEQNTRRNLRLTAALIQLVENLQAEAIPVLPFKGPLLAQRLYGNLGLRQFSDLDILVPRQDFPRAVAIVEASDYRPKVRNASLPPAQAAAFMRWFQANSMAFRHITQGDKLELHWVLVPGNWGFSIDQSNFWERLEETVISNMKVLSMPWPDLILYLCVHGTCHHWLRLSWLADVAAFLHRHSDIDWTHVLQQAEAMGSTRMLLLGIFLAHRLLDAKLPGILADRVGEEEDKLAQAAAMCGLVDDQSEQVGPYAMWKFARVVQERKPWNQPYFVEHFLRPKKSLIEWIQLPAWLFPLYFVMRPFELLGKSLARSLGYLNKKISNKLQYWQ